MEDEVIATLSIILLCAPMKLLKKRKVKMNCWTRSWIKQRNVVVAHHVLIEQLRREDPNSYANFLISPDIFHKSSSSSHATTSFCTSIFEKSAISCKNHVLYYGTDADV
jgi:hypothetical protein